MIVAGIIYASIIALNQTDLKRFAAWVSIAHAGLITAGALTLEQAALQGVVIQMISHGINIVGLFVIIDIIERKYKTRDINELGGLARINPWLGIFFMIILLATVALPVTNGFPGEFLILLGLFRFNPWIGVVAGTTIILGAVYMLGVYQKVMLGPGPENPEMFNNRLTGFELAALIPLVLLVFVIGCCPTPVLGLAGPAPGLHPGP